MTGVVAVAKLVCDVMIVLASAETSNKKEEQELFHVDVSFLREHREIRRI